MLFLVKKNGFGFLKNLNIRVITNLYILNKMEILSTKEKTAINKFSKKGYYIFDIKNKKILEKIKKKIIKESSKLLKKNWLVISFLIILTITLRRII